MLERYTLCRSHQWLAAFHLRLDGVACVAVLLQHLAICSNVIAVMATEATGRVEVSNVVRMNPPVHFHFWEDAVLVNALDLRDRRLDLRLLRSVHIRILTVVK